MDDFSFGFTEGSFLLLNGQKHLRSVAGDLISNKQKRTERIYQKRRRHGGGGGGGLPNKGSYGFVGPGIKYFRGQFLPGH